MAQADDIQYYSQIDAVMTGRASVTLVHLLYSLNKHLSPPKRLFSPIVQPKQSKIHEHSNHCSRRHFSPPKSVVYEHNHYIIDHKGHCAM